MALRREVDHRVRPLLGEQAVHRLPVADVRLYEAEIGPPQHRGQLSEVPRVGQLVQTHHPVPRMGLQPVKDEVRADEPGASGDQDRHVRSSNSQRDIRYQSENLSSATRRRCSP